MKFSILSTVAMLSTLAPAVPTPNLNEFVARAQIAKRATITNACDLGYASTNNETAGGAGGTTTKTVFTLAQFTAAVTDDSAAKVVVVSGTITGIQNVRLDLNKFLIGLPGASMLL